MPIKKFVSHVQSIEDRKAQYNKSLNADQSKTAQLGSDLIKLKDLLKQAMAADPSIG